MTQLPRYGISGFSDERFARNLGLFSEDDQALLGKSHVAVCGLGGMGGVAAEALARMGVGSLTIADHDSYERSNINRQLQCTEGTLGAPKVEIVADRLKEINPHLRLRTFGAVNRRDLPALLEGASIVVNGMDDVRASVLLERKAHQQNITIVDSWITPFASVFVITPDAPHWEEFLNFPTQGKEPEMITDEEVTTCLTLEARFTLGQFNPLEYVSEETVKKTILGEMKRPSLVPVVWLSGILMANEAMKILTTKGRIASHWGVFYNQYDHEIRYFSQNERGANERASLQQTGG